METICFKVPLNLHDFTRNNLWWHNTFTDFNIFSLRTHKNHAHQYITERENFVQVHSAVTVTRVLHGMKRIAKTGLRVKIVEDIASARSIPRNGNDESAIQASTTMSLSSHLYALHMQSTQPMMIESTAQSSERDPSRSYVRFAQGDCRWIEGHAARVAHSPVTLSLSLSLSCSWTDRSSAAPSAS